MLKKVYVFFFKFFVFLFFLDFGNLDFFVDVLGVVISNILLIDDDWLLLVYDLDEEFEWFGEGWEIMF